MEIYIDATNMILGRIASYAAKKALLGNSINILNCGDAVITGNKKDIFGKYKHRRERGNTVNGPFFPKIPDRLVRRTVRGMLPYKQPRGSEAFKRVMCYIGVPEEFKGKKMITLPSADVAKTKNFRFVHVKDVCKLIGGKI